MSEKHIDQALIDIHQCDISARETAEKSINKQREMPRKQLQRLFAF